MGSIFVLTGWVYFFGDADLFVGWFASVTKSQLATSECFSFQIKAFNLERVDSKDGFPHKKHGILWLDSRARPHWKTPPKKEAAVGENLFPTAPLFLGRFLCYLECYLARSKLLRWRGWGLIHCFSVLLLFSETFLRNPFKKFHLGIPAAWRHPT